MVVFKLYSKYATDYFVYETSLTEPSNYQDEMCLKNIGTQKTTLKSNLNLTVVLTNVFCHGHENHTNKTVFMTFKILS